MFRRPLIPLTALFWGLQFAFLSPALALILVSLYHATPAEVGWVLASYNAAGFVASLALPAWADRREDYLRPLLACAVLTLALAVALSASTSLPIATVALIVLGGPAGVGTSLLFAYQRHSGAGTADVMNTRAVFSFAWVAGPPIATALIGWLGNPSVLVAIGIVAVLNAVTTIVMIRRKPDAPSGGAAGSEPESATSTGPMSGSRVAVILVAFVLAQATNAATTSVMALFVTQSLGLPVLWAGIALSLAAGLEIPALIILGKLSRRRSLLGLLLLGCGLGVAYYVGMALASGVVALLALQALNACFFAAVSGVGLTVFQDIVPRAGLATGLYTNTRRVGAILSGPVIGIASGPWGYPGIYAACAAMTLAAGLAIWGAGRRKREPVEVPSLS